MGIKSWFQSKSDPLTADEARAAYVKPAPEFAPTEQQVTKLVNICYNHIRTVMRKRRFTAVCYERFEVLDDKDDAMHQRAMLLGSAVASRLAENGFNVEVNSRDVPPADDEEEDCDMTQYSLVITWGPQQ